MPSPVFVRKFYRTGQPFAGNLNLFAMFSRPVIRQSRRENILKKGKMFCFWANAMYGPSIDPSHTPQSQYKGGELKSKGRNLLCLFRLLSPELSPPCFRRPPYFCPCRSRHSALTDRSIQAARMTRHNSRLAATVEGGDGTLNCRQPSQQLRFFLFQCFPNVQETSVDCSWDGRNWCSPSEVLERSRKLR